MRWLPGRGLALLVLTVPGQIPRGGPEMSRIWRDLRTPARENPNPIPFPDSVLLPVLMFGIGVVVIALTLWLLLFAFR